MLEKDCNGKPISTFPPFYAFQMIFTALALRLIQSISRNVHNKFCFEIVVYKESTLCYSCNSFNLSLETQDPGGGLLKCCCVTGGSLQRVNSEIGYDLALHDIGVKISMLIWMARRTGL